MKKFEDLSEIRQEFSKRNGYQGLFATRDTVQDALDYAQKITNTLRPEDKIGVITAVQMLMNTIAVREANTILLEDFCKEELGMAKDLQVEHINHFLEEVCNGR